MPLEVVLPFFVYRMYYYTIIILYYTILYYIILYITIIQYINLWSPLRGERAREWKKFSESIRDFHLEILSAAPAHS